MKSQSTEELKLYLTVSPNGAYALPPALELRSGDWGCLDRDYSDLERKILFAEKGVLRERGEPKEGCEVFKEILRELVWLGESNRTQLMPVEKRTKNRGKKKAKPAFEESASA